jgi:hypothetical protein
MQIDLIVGSTTYSLSDGNPYKLENANGLAMPPTKRFSRRYPGQDGYDDLGHVFEPRAITLSLLFTAATQAALDGHRDTLQRMFGPGTNALLVLQATRDDGEVRRLDVTAAGLSVVPVDPAHRPGRLHRATVKLRAADPIWYSPTTGTVTFGSADPTVWYLASNRIAAGDVLEALENPGTAVNFAGFPVASNYSYMIAVRGTVPASSTVEYTAWTGNYLSFNSDQQWTFSIKRLASTHESANQLVWSWGGSATSGYTWAGTALLGNYSGSVVSIIFATDQIKARIYVDEEVVFRQDSYIGPMWNYYLTFKEVLTGSQWRPVVGGTTWPSMQYAASYHSFSTFDESKIIALSRSMAGLNESYSMAGSVIYNGDYEEYPVITLTGPLSGPVLYNDTTGRKLDFTGSTVPAGDYYTIDLRRDALFAVDSGGTVRTIALSDDSALAGWNFDGPVQNISVTASAGGTASSTQIVYRNRYVSY